MSSHGKIQLFVGLLCLLVFNFGPVMGQEAEGTGGDSAPVQLEGLRKKPVVEQESKSENSETNAATKSSADEKITPKPEEDEKADQEVPPAEKSEIEKQVERWSEDGFDADPLDILDGANPLGKVDQLVDEISRNMKEIERLLDQDDTGDSNQSVQQQTLSRIDELINEVQRLGGG